MTLSEFRDIFIAEYSFESQKRGAKGVKPNNKLIAAWIAEAQQDISTRLKPIKTFQDIPILTGTATYSLNTNFGKAICAKLGDAIGTIGDTDIELVDTMDMLSTDPSGNKAAIYWDSVTSVYKLMLRPSPTSNYYIRVWYYVDTGWYSPSGVTGQNWGSFSGTAFSGNLKIPDKYQMLVKYYLLGKCFSDYSQYEKQLSILRVNNADTMDNKPTYQWNDP